MSRTHQSKQNSTSEIELWFAKNNYMSKFLNDKSLKIIEKIKKRYANSNR
jgi:predicted transcriptional regulator